MLLRTGSPDSRRSHRHRGYVAGRYRDGALSDGWTDVSRCASATFTAYLAACECGWHGVARAATSTGADACRQDWAADHGDPAPADLPHG